MAFEQQRNDPRLTAVEKGRVPLVVDYDPRFGFIRDGVIETTSGRKVFRRRPSLRINKTIAGVVAATRPLGAALFQNIDPILVTVTTVAAPHVYTFTRTGAQLSVGSFIGSINGNGIGCVGAEGTTTIVHESGQLRRITSSTTSTLVNPAATTGKNVNGGPVFFGNRNHYLSFDGYVYSSALGDSTAWGALTFLSAFSNLSVRGTTLMTHNNNIVAFGDSELRFLYDTGASVGSPLAPDLTNTVGIGLTNAKLVIGLHGDLFFLGRSLGSNTSAYIIKKGSYTPQRVSDAVVDVALQAFDGSLNSQALSAGSFGGHDLYIVSQGNGAISSLVFDATELRWYEWTYTQANLGGLSGLPAWYQSIYVPSDQNSVTQTSGDYMQFYGGFGADVRGFLFDTPALQDSAASYSGILRTRPLDFGLTNYKQFHSITLVGDRVITGPATCQLQYSDDNNTFGNARTFDLTAIQPIQKNFGQARRRAWQLVLDQPVDSKHEALEIEFSPAST